MGKTINWNDVYTNGDDYTVLTTQQLSQLIEMLPKSLAKKHLDIGCGTGQLCRDLFHRGYITTGIDTSDVAINLAKQATDQENNSIKFLVGDINDATSKFDLITCKYVYVFIDDKDRFLDKITTILNDLGSFVVISPNIATLPDGKKQIALPSEEIESKLSEYFDVKVIPRGAAYYYICSLL